ncbi:hypothetical protein Hanom_Chr16g01469351 [Helianthus anomalus]
MRTKYKLMKMEGGYMLKYPNLNNPNYPTFIIHAVFFPTPHFHHKSVTDS